MKAIILRSLVATLILGAAFITELKAQAQLFPTAAVLLSKHNISDYTINSIEDYSRLESSISTISQRLASAYQSHPNLQYLPSYNENGEIAGFIVTGVSNSIVANDISSMLMQLEVLSEIAQAADEKFYPAAEMGATRVTRKEATR
ncbi:MAG: hypothetical protein WKF87_14515 [Chryseolinea sp.]